MVAGLLLEHHQGVPAMRMMPLQKWYEDFSCKNKNKSSLKTLSFVPICRKDLYIFMAVMIELEFGLCFIHDPESHIHVSLPLGHAS